jgi:GMP synthase (glutamine-hydrolysing)
VPQVTVLDTGGQYCHLIARKVRELGVYAEVRPSDTPAPELKGRKAIIISGGPSSVYDPGSPTVDPAIFQAGYGVLGICYGLQLMAQLMGGDVRKGQKGEFGFATLDIDTPDTIFKGIEGQQQIWMSHRDAVASVPDGFQVIAHTSTCKVAAMVDPERRLYGLQFHPEVIHTPRGKEVLKNFLFNVSECAPDWDPEHQIPQLENEIRRVARDRNVVFFVSGGVDSTVAYLLCLRALGADRVRGVYVDTGLMRAGETEMVESMFATLGAGTVTVEHGQQHFLEALEGVCDPEKKRHIIGQEFLNVQERFVENWHLLDGHWILGQGTIYPDTIESGGTTQAATIKTHHNRVAGIQKLIEAGQITEPLHSFYKDEVRQVGRQLGVPEKMLQRHPFPGPGLAIRCLCSDEEAGVTPLEDGWILPVHSVGVQGDSRSYAPVLALDERPNEGSHARATELINRLTGFNRVIACVDSQVPVRDMKVFRRTLTAERLEILRQADALVRQVCESTGFERHVWQFPVVLIPAGTLGRRDSVVLRPVDSVDGMTAQSVLIPEPVMRAITLGISSIPGVCAVFLDLTHKPPATIEWE